MGILKLDTKKAVRRVLLTMGLYVSVIAISAMTIIKPAHASGTVSAGEDLGYCSVGFGGYNYITISECVVHTEYTFQTNYPTQNWHGCFYDTTDTGETTIKHYVDCYRKKLTILETDPYLDEKTGTWNYQTNCPINSTGTTTCTCNAGYIPDQTETGCVKANSSNPEQNPIPQKNVGICIPCLLKQMWQGNPVNSGTGNKFQTETDYAGVGVYPLHAERFYNSGGATPSVIEKTMWGSQWRGYYDRSIAVVTNSVATTAVIKRDDGRKQYYRLNGSWVGDADVVGNLVGSAGTGWTYTNENDEVETYDANGKLISLTNRAGQVQTLTYSDGTASSPNGGYVLDASGNPTATILPAGKLIRVTDPSGRTLHYGYDAAGRVVKMTDPAGGAYIYTYSGTAATDNLIKVTYPDTKFRTYLYGEAANVSSTPNAGVSYAHSLTGILDENGDRYASWTYDAAGLATSSEHGAFGSGIDHVGLSYGTLDSNGNSTTSVTDPRSNNRSYGFSTLIGVVKNTGITGQPCDGCTAAYTYDANGNVASRTDFNGNQTTYVYDLTRNLETSRTEGLTSAGAKTAATRTINTSWNASYRLPASITEQDTSGASAVTLRTTSFGYDTSGNLLTKTLTDGQTPANTRTTTYTYNAAGQVLTVNGPRTDVSDITTYTYDTQGNLVTVTNALNQVTNLGGYDANGRPGTLTDPNGLVTSLVYDPRGRLTSRVTGGETTGYSYDGVGQLLTVTLPSGAAYTYSYDAAHRLTGIADNLGNHISYTLDVMGNRTQEQIRDAANTLVQTHSRVFNALNQLYQDIGAVNQTTTYTYDNDGNVQTITDPLNRLSSNSYDALNRLITNTDPESGVTHYGYDALDQLTSVTDPRNLVTQYTRDGLGNLDQQVSPDTGTTTNTYDAAGNLLTRTDAKGQTATYTYDALNRVTGISYSGGTAPAQTIAYQYDQGTNGIGHLTRITDSTGITNYGYDQHGRLTSEIEQAYSATYTTAYTYDAQGRLNGITYPSGRTVNYTFDGMGRISQIATTYNSTTTILASNVTYEPFGGVHSFTYGDGTAPVQTYVRQRDQDGRIASYTLNGQTKSIGYDAASQIISISDPAYPALYDYDALSRLTGYTQGSLSQGYDYDADGNRTSQTIGSTTTAYGYPTTSNRLASITVGAGSPQTVTQDAIGATTSDPARQYTYDIRGRLVQATTAQGAINYEVNALGLRVRKQVPYANTDTLYHYDAQGHLIAENENGSTHYAREYIYLGDQPIAVMQ
jgi:YD repeat-containing protein